MVSPCTVLPIPVVMWMRMAPNNLYLNTWSPVAGTVGEGWGGGMALLEEVYHWEWALRFQKTHNIPGVSPSTSWLYLELSAPSHWFSTSPICPLPRFPPSWSWTLILWSNNSQINAYPISCLGHGILLQKQNNNYLYFLCLWASLIHSPFVLLSSRADSASNAFQVCLKSAHFSLCYGWYTPVFPYQLLFSALHKPGVVHTCNPAPRCGAHL